MSTHPRSSDRVSDLDPCLPLPCQTDAEKSVLGSMLIDPAGTIPKMAERLRPEQFHATGHATIFALLLRGWTEGTPFDVVTLTKALREINQLDAVGGPSYVSHLFTFTPTAVNVDYYARYVEEAAWLREIHLTARAVSEAALRHDAEPSELSERLQLLLTRLAREASTHRAVATMADLIPDALNRLEERHQGRGRLRGIPSGLGLLDRLTGGWQGGQMIVVAAREKEGKSSLARQFVLEAAVTREVKTAIFSHEMGRAEITDALIATRARVDSKRLEDGSISEDEFSKIGAAAQALARAPIFVFDEADSSVLQFRANARRAVREHGCGLIVLDYLQLVGGHGNEKSRQEEVAAVSRNVKLAAKELNVPIIVLSQLNDKGATRESMAIQQDLDKLIVIEHENPEAEGDAQAWIKVKLQRGGAKGSVPVTWRPSITRFDPLASERDEPSLTLLSTPPVAPWDHDHNA